MAIGPMTLYFVRSQIKGQKQFDPKSLLHLLPMILVAGYAIFFVSYNDDRELWSRSIVRGIYYYWGAYLFYAAFLIITQKYVLKKRFNEDRWTQSVVLGVLLIWMAYVTSSFTSYLTGALTFSFIIYLMVWMLLTRKHSSRKVRSIKVNVQDPNQANQVLEKIHTVFEKNDRFKNPDLTMPAVAKLLHLTPHQFSSLINDQLGQNFSQLINTYRIKVAEQMLRDEHYITVEAIGFDCGFNSASTFHSAFKKHTGMTPAAFRKQILASTDL